MMIFLVYLVSVLASIGSLICFIVVLVRFFKSGQTTLGIVCLVALLLCGLGGLIAFVKGWIDGLGTVMVVWTICIVVGILTSLYIQFAAGGFMPAG